MYKQFWEDRLANIAINGNEINADCPICDKAKHFYANIETGQFDCKKCQKKIESWTKNGFDLPY